MKTLSSPYTWAGLVLSTALVCLIYSNAVNAPFYFDDEPNIQLNRHIRLTDLGFASLSDAGFQSPLHKRPVSNISLALNYYFGQYQVTGYHVVNIIIHLINGIFLYLFTRLTLGLSHFDFKRTSQISIAFFAALIWLVHPIQTQSVTYIVQRMNSLATLFFMLSLLLYIKARLVKAPTPKWLLFSGALVAWLLALGSKEIAATLPFFIFLYEWYFFQNVSTSWLKANLRYVFYTLVLFVLVVFLYQGSSPLTSILSGYSIRDFTLTERLLTQFRVIVYYISLLLYPHPARLSLLHDFPVSRSLIDPMSTLVSMAVIAAILISAAWAAKKRPLISFCLLWFFGNLAIESSVINLEIIYEHRTYLPSMLISLMFVVLVHRYVKPRLVTIAMLGAVVFMFALWTYQRNNLWASELAFWSDCAQKAPNSPRVYHSLGNVYLKNGQLEPALKAYRKALCLDPNYVDSYIGLGAALREKGDIKKAIIAHKKAITIAPDYAPAHNHLGADHLGQGRADLAIDNFKKAIQEDPYSADSYNDIGLAYAKLGYRNKAIDMYKRAIAIRPDFSMAYSNLGSMYLNTKPDKAVRLLKKAITIQPALPDPHANLGVAFIHSGFLAKGILELKKAVRLEPRHKEATFNLARAYELQGQYAKAVDQYDRSIQLNPHDMQAYYRIGLLLLQRLQDKTRATLYLDKALLIDAQDPSDLKRRKAIADLAKKAHEQ